MPFIAIVIYIYIYIYESIFQSIKVEKYKLIFKKRIKMCVDFGHGYGAITRIINGF